MEKIQRDIYKIRMGYTVRKVYVFFCIGIAGLFIFLLAGLQPVRSHEPSGIEQGYTDVHVHIISRDLSHGLPGKEGLGPGKGPGPHRDGGGRGAKKGRPEADWDGAGRNLIEKMDKSGVASSIIMPPPRVRNNIDPSEYDALLSLSRKYPGRLYVGGGGQVLNPMIQETDAEAVTAEIRARFRREAERLVYDGVRCFGEMAATHISHTPNHPFEESPPDHPLFLLLADIAAKNNIPIDLHMDTVALDIPTPAGWRKLSQQNPEIFHANVPGLERLLAHNRDARIVLQHVGRDNIGHLTVGLLRRILSENSNLYLAVHVSPNPNMAGQDTLMPNRVIDEDFQIKPEWLKLFHDFPDRFVVGTDEFSSPVESERGPFESTWRIFDKQLPPDLRAKICGKNAARIYGLKLKGDLRI